MYPADFLPVAQLIRPRMAAAVPAVPSGTVVSTRWLSSTDGSGMFVSIVSSGADVAGAVVMGGLVVGAVVVSRSAC